MRPARTAVAGSGNTSCPVPRKRMDRRQRTGDRAGHRHPPGRVQQLLDPARRQHLEILQELGFTYHIDDLSADEPLLQTINGQPFATVPYSVHLNDIASFDSPGFNPAAYTQQLTDEFDQLYAEGAARRRMMVIGLHERLSGHASRVRVLDRIFTRLRYHEDVWWARKDQIAQWVLDHPDTAAWVERGPAPVSVLPGPSA